MLVDNQIIAERELKYSAKNSSDLKDLVVRIGMPYIDDEGIARCPVEWDGLFENYADIAGMDLVQALQLASNLDSLIEKLTHKYDFYWSNGDSYFDE